MSVDVIHDDDQPEYFAFETLDPCPHCGSSLLVYKQHYENLSVFCENCGMSGPNSNGSPGLAHDLWNRLPRIDPPS